MFGTVFTQKQERMPENTITRTSRRLSWLLRHGAIQSGLEMDAAGWCSTEALLKIAGISRALLADVVEKNDKPRLQIDGDRIRASQGHSLAGAPVTVAGLEASWATWSGTHSLWHGTHSTALASIARMGLTAQGRTHVHLAQTPDSQVGKARGVELMLEIDPQRVRAAGQRIYRSPNGVILIRHVPRAGIVALHPLSRGARHEAPQLRAVLGL